MEYLAQELATRKLQRDQFFARTKLNGNGLDRTNYWCLLKKNTHEKEMSGFVTLDNQANPYTIFTLERTLLIGVSNSRFASDSWPGNTTAESFQLSSLVGLELCPSMQAEAIYFFSHSDYQVPAL